MGAEGAGSQNAKCSSYCERPGKARRQQAVQIARQSECETRSPWQSQLTLNDAALRSLACTAYLKGKRQPGQASGSSSSSSLLSASSSSSSRPLRCCTALGFSRLVSAAVQLAAQARAAEGEAPKQCVKQLAVLCLLCARSLDGRCAANVPSVLVLGATTELVAPPRPATSQPSWRALVSSSTPPRISSATAPSQWSSRDATKW